MNNIIKALNLECPDKIPVLPLVGVHSTKIAGINVSDALRDGEKMAKAELFALGKYNYDGILPLMDLTVEAEAMGCEIFEQGEEIPSVSKPVLNDPEDIKKLRVPDPKRDGRLPVFLKAVEKISRSVGDSVAVGAYVAGPLTLANHLIGVKNLLASCIRNPEVVDKLLKITTEVGITYEKNLFEVGVHMVAILEPVGGLVSLAHFNRFLTPHLSKMVDEARKNNVFSILHICGNASHLLEEMIKTGVNGISIGSPVDIGFARKQVGHKVCILGNVDPVKIMLRGTPSDVKMASEGCIKKAGRRAFILSSGCELPRDTPIENIEAMVKVAKCFNERGPI